MSINYTPRTWTTGEVVTAAYMNNEIMTPFSGLQAAWSTMTPTITATTNPNLGSAGVTVGRYCQIGKTVFVRGTLTFGGTGIGGGTGQWVLNLPVPATIINIANSFTHIHVGYLCAAGRYVGQAIISDNGGSPPSGSMWVQDSATSMTATQAGTPGVWSAGAYTFFDGVLESA